MAKRSQAWKDNERVVAKFFGVNRRTRGDDFSQVDVEVIAPYVNWEEAACEANPGDEYPIRVSSKFPGGVVVECKHRRSAGCNLPTLFRGVSDRRPDIEMIPIVLWGDYILSWMTDVKRGPVLHRSRHFDWVWNFLVCDTISANVLVENFYIEWFNRQTPKYLADWMDQAQSYQYKANEKCFPLVEVHTSGKEGRLMVWKGPFGIGLNGRAESSPTLRRRRSETRRGDGT